MSDPIKVIYNANCPICSREIDHYRRRTEAGDAAVEFLPLKQASAFGLTEDQAARRLHVIQGNRIMSGADAFIALWHRVPGFDRLARLVERPLARRMMHWTYERLLAPTLYALHKRRVRRATRLP